MFLLKVSLHFYRGLSILAISISPITIAFEHLIILNVFILITSLKKLEVLLLLFMSLLFTVLFPFIFYSKIGDEQA